MASGRTHRALGLTAAATVALVGTTYNYHPEIWATGLGCALAAVCFNPDLDVDGGYIGNRAARKVGLEGLYKVFFRPYREAYKHRSVWSHGPVISTLWRLVYIVLPLVAVFFKDQPTSRVKLVLYALPAQIIAFGVWLVILVLWYYSLTNFAIWFIIGLMINDILHWGADLWP